MQYLVARLERMLGPLKLSDLDTCALRMMHGQMQAVVRLTISPDTGSKRLGTPEAAS